MSFNWKQGVIVGSLIIALIALAMVVLSMFKQSAQNVQTVVAGQQIQPFGQAAATPTSSGSTGSSGVTLPSFASPSGNVSQQPIFKIVDGPVVSATLVTYSNPTTTSAQWVTSQDGHVYEQLLDASGTAPKLLSNVTIPGIQRALWTDRGNGVLMQYVQAGVIKTVHISFSTTTAATGSLSRAPLVRFLPDNITALAVSPDGARCAYQLQTGLSQSDIYTARSDGGSAAKLFSIPLSELELSWPAASSLFIYTKSAGGAPGLAFSGNIKTGVVTPMLYGVGLTATANPLFSAVLYRTDTGSGSTLYVEPIASGVSTAVNTAASSLDTPLPETCVWDPNRPLRAFCAAPSSGVASNYLDLWHRGQSSVPSALVGIDATTGVSIPLATPGSRDGGEASDIINLSISSDGRYLAFISKDDGRLWGIRASQ